MLLKWYMDKNSKKLLFICTGVIVCLSVINLISASWSIGLNNGLKGYWKLDSQTGGVTLDSLGLNNGTLINAPALNVTGIINNASNYSSGQSQKIDLGTETNWDTLLDGQHNVTISFWASQTDDGIRGSEGFVCKGQEPQYFCIRKDNAVDNNKLMVHLKGTSDIHVKTTNEIFPADNVLRHIVLVYNGTGSGGIAIWVNGTYQPLTITSAGTTTISSNENLTIGRASENTVNQFLNGKVDELGIWDRTLSDSEITQLYNSGSGITYDPILIITLNSPSDNNVSLNNTIIFNITSNDTSSVGLKNITLLINNIVNETKTISNFINETTFNKSLAIGNYTWKVNVCNLNGCVNSSERNFNITNIIINSVNYNSPVTSGSNETFILNASLSSPYTSVQFIYNNTIYNSVISLDSGGNYLFTNNVFTPLADSLINKTFFWQINTTTQNLTSNLYNQTLSPFSINFCNATYNITALNFTIKEEATFALLNGSLEMNIIYYPVGGIASINQTFSFSNLSQNQTNYAFCITPGTANLSITGLVQYARVGYDPRTYYFNNAVINNITQNIDLFLLLTADSDIFTFKVLDENDQGVTGALIYVQRWDIGTNNFYTVGMTQTTEGGSAVINLNLNEGAFYRQLVFYNGILYLTTIPAIETTSSTPKTLRIFTSALNPYLFFNNIQYSFTYTNSTSIFSFVYADPSGTVETGCLTIYKLTNLNGSNLIYSSCVQSTSGTLSYTLTENGTFIGVASFVLSSSYNNVNQNVKTIMVTKGRDTKFYKYNTFGYVASFLLIGTLAMLGVAAGSIPFGCILIIAGMVVSSLLGLVNFSMTVLYGFIGLVIIIAFTALRRFG